jgi:hypothetical protein
MGYEKVDQTSGNKRYLLISPFFGRRANTQWSLKRVSDDLSESFPATFCERVK